MTPVEPPKKAIGMNTADSTTAMPTSAPLISPMLLRVASRGDRPSSRISRSTFSTTTIASSTNRPMASTRPNMVSVLIEKPATASTPIVPNMTTGTAMAGISVARMFCMNRYMIATTSTIASSSVFTTPSIETRTKGVVSKVTVARIPGGKNGASSSSLAFTASAVTSALAPLAGKMAMPAAVRPLVRMLVV